MAITFAYPFVTVVVYAATVAVYSVTVVVTSFVSVTTRNPDGTTGITDIAPPSLLELAVVAAAAGTTLAAVDGESSTIVEVELSATIA